MAQTHSPFIDGFSEGFAEDYQQFALDYKNIFRVFGVNCAQFRDICKKESIESSPTVRVYPPMPIPIFDIEGEITSKKIARKAARYVENNVIQITADNIDTWIMDSPSVPKVLLFTDKKKVPFMFKALSSAFKVRFYCDLYHQFIRKSSSLVWSIQKRRLLPGGIESMTSQRLLSSRPLRESPSLIKAI